MSYDLSNTTEALSQQVNKTPVLILEIEGSRYIYGSGSIKETLKWDDDRVTFDNNIPGATWDGTIEIENSRPYISMRDSTKNVSQQLLVEKGGAGSVPSMSIALVDYRGEVAEDLSFNQIGEPIGKKAIVSIMLEGGVYGLDENRIFEGYVDQITYEPGLIKVNITHPSNETRQPLFESLGTRLTQPLPFKRLDLTHLSFRQLANLLSTTGEILIVSNPGPIDGERTASSLAGNVVTITYDSTATPVVTQRELADALNNNSYAGGYMEAVVIGSPTAAAATQPLTILETETTVTVENANPFFESQDVLVSYIRVGDEIMEVTSKVGNTFEVIRGSRGTVPASHDVDDEVTSAYELKGLPLDLSLKLLLSSQNNEFTTSTYNVVAINYIDNTQSIDGAIIVDNIDVELNTGLTVGDFIDLTGEGFGIETVSGFGKLDDGRSYIIVESALGEVLSTSSPLIYKSKWNLLPEGIGLDVSQVDVAEFERQAALFSASFIELDFLLQSTIDNLKDFIESELMRPQALYYLPKGSKISCKYTTAPFSSQTLPTLNTTNIEKMSKVIFKRAHHKYFKNVLVYNYNPDVVEEKFRDKLILQSESSFNRVSRGVKKESISASGLRRSNEVLQVLNTAGLKYLNRYKFGARWVENISVTYEVGILLQIGDIVFFGGEDTKLVNLETGDRDFPIEQYEIINIDHNYAQASVKISLLETGFSTDGLFGVFSPSSLVSSGSTNSRLILTDAILESEDNERETDKWRPYVGLKIRVYSPDYTRDETITLNGIDPQNQDAVLLETPLSFAPQVGDIMELAEIDQYGTSDAERSLKLKFTWTMPSVLVTGAVDGQIFDVENVDGLEVGMEIAIHSTDYLVDSETRIIDDINNLTITLDSSLDIGTPQVGDRLEVYAYSNEKGYRFL